jgi:hypothetical protein
MEQDLKEKVQEQAAVWDAAEETRVMKIMSDRAKAQQYPASQAEEGDKVEGSREDLKSKLTIKTKLYEQTYSCSAGKRNIMYSLRALSAIFNY